MEKEPCYLQTSFTAAVPEEKMYQSPQRDSTIGQLVEQKPVAPERTAHEYLGGCTLHSTHFISWLMKLGRKKTHKLAPLFQLFGFERHPGSEETAEEFALK